VVLLFYDDFYFWVTTRREARFPLLTPWRDCKEQAKGFPHCILLKMKTKPSTYVKPREGLQWKSSHDASWEIGVRARPDVRRDTPKTLPLTSFCSVKSPALHHPGRLIV